MLLVENDSIALMAYGPFVEVYEKTYACQCPDGADEVWYVDTGIGSGPDYYRVA